MFLHSTHLPQRLCAEDYTSEEVYQHELKTLFLPGWHCVAVSAQLPKMGDYLSLEILGRPLIIWHTAEGFRTFLNVCAHRFCRLTDAKSGHASPTLKCQYHGWEYDSTGNTCKIPDAQSFRPLVKGELGLREYRTDMIGQMIFVSLAEKGPSLRDYLGPELVSLCDDWFGPDARFMCDLEFRNDCNWKVTVENALESYHIECVHSKTFAHYPEPEYCQHAFSDYHDHFIHDYTHEAKTPVTSLERFVAWLGGIGAELRYHNLLRYPNILWGKGGQVAYIQMFWPLSPNKVHIRMLCMARTGPRGRWGSEVAHWLTKWYGTSFVRRVMLEDAGITPSVQAGTAAADRPHGGGLISIREERIFAFQDYLLKNGIHAQAAATNGQATLDRSNAASHPH